MQLMEVKMEEYKQLNFRANDVVSDFKKYVEDKTPSNAVSRRQLGYLRGALRSLKNSVNSFSFLEIDRFVKDFRDRNGYFDERKGEIEIEIEMYFAKLASINNERDKVSKETREVIEANKEAVNQ